jgi:hypothetical protein
MPLATHEVRWFFDGWANEAGILSDWFLAANPFSRDEEIPEPEWKDWRTDVYLLIPGGTDMGIKWREEELQIKGRVASFGLQVFAGRHRGYSEGWVKWSFAGMPEPYRDLFNEQDAKGLIRVPVEKRRILRKLRVNPITAAGEEVSAEVMVDRGVTAELTNLVVGDAHYCTLGFEAFPHDSAMFADFKRVVEAFLATLRGVSLEAASSRSYPEWLWRVNS